VIPALIVWLALGTAASAQLATGDLLGLANFTPTLIEVIRGDSRVVLEKNGSDWMMLEPVLDRANQAAVEELLQRLGNLTIADVLQGEPGQFGLDAPTATVRLVNSQGEARELLIGNFRSPVSLFVAPRGSDEVYAISNVSLARIGQHPAAFLDTLLLSLDPASIVGYEILIMPEIQEDEASDSQQAVAFPPSEEAALAGSGEAGVAQGTGGIGIIEIGSIEGETGESDPVPAGVAEAEPYQEEREPVTIQATRSGSVWLTPEGTVAFDVEGFLRSMRLVQAADRARQVPEDAFFPAPGAAKIVLNLQDGDSVTLEIGVTTPDGKYNYAKVSERDEVYLVPRFQAAHVVGQALGINDSLLTLDPDRVAQLTISIGPGGEEVVYRRNNDGFWESNRAIVFNFTPLLEAISSVEARRAAAPLDDERGYGFDTAERSVRAEIRFTDNNTLRLLIGGPTPQGDGVYVTTSEREGVYAGVQASVDALIEAAEAVRTRLFPLVESQVTALELIVVDASGAEARTRIVQNGSEWQRNGESISGADVSNLLSQLAQLSADSLPPVPDDPAELGFYPAPESRRIVVEFQDGTQRFLDIGGKVEVGSGWFATVNYYVQVSDLDDLTFVREQTLRRLFQAMDALK